MPSRLPYPSAPNRLTPLVLLSLLAAMFALIQCEATTQPEKGKKTPAGKFPKTVLLIRHAEKPEGAPDPHLTSRGAARAAALPSLFTIPPAFPTRPARFPTPDYVYATNRSAKSNRPVETVAPLATALKLKVDSRFHNKEFPDLAREILSGKQAGRTVLVCWHQGTMPMLAQCLLDLSPDREAARRIVPNDWKDSVFDRVWTLRYEVDGTVTFVDEPQRLLFGDRAK